jgi:hypothetical protein
LEVFCASDGRQEGEFGLEGLLGGFRGGDVVAEGGGLGFEGGEVRWRLVVGGRCLEGMVDELFACGTESA